MPGSRTKAPQAEIVAEHCFWDSFPFHGPGHRLPMEKTKDGNTKGSKFKFCSRACMLSFLLDTSMFSDGHKATIRGYIVEDILESTKSVEEIVTVFAPPRFTLKRFGGELTIEQFRQSIGQSSFDPVDYKMISVPIPVEKRTIYRGPPGAISISDAHDSSVDSDIIELD